MIYMKNVLIFFRWSNDKQQKVGKFSILCYLYNMLYLGCLRNVTYLCSATVLMKKDPSLSCKASGRALLPRPLRTDVRMQLIALQLTNALKESTTGR